MTHIFQHVHVNNLIIDNTTFKQKFFHDQTNIPQTDTFIPHRLYRFTLENPSSITENELQFYNHFMHKRIGEYLYVFVKDIRESLCYTYDEVFRAIQPIINILKSTHENRLMYIHEINLKTESNNDVSFPIRLQANEIRTMKVIVDYGIYSINSFTRIICEDTNDFSVFAKYDSNNMNNEQTLQNHKNYLTLLNGENDKLIKIVNKQNHEIEINNLTFMVPPTERSNVLCKVIRIPHTQIIINTVMDNNHITLTFPNHIIQCENIFAYSSFGHKLKLKRSIFDGYHTRATWLLPDTCITCSNEPFFIFRNIKDVLNNPYLNENNLNHYIYPSLTNQTTSNFTYSFGQSHHRFSKIEFVVVIDYQQSHVKVVFPNVFVNVIDISVYTQEGDLLSLLSSETNSYATSGIWLYDKEKSDLSINEQVFVFQNIKGDLNNVYVKNGQNIFVYPNIESYAVQTFSVGTGMMI